MPPCNVFLPLTHQPPPKKSPSSCENRPLTLSQHEEVGTRTSRTNGRTEGLSCFLESARETEQERSKGGREGDICSSSGGDEVNGVENWTRRRRRLSRWNMERRRREGRREIGREALRRRRHICSRDVLLGKDGTREGTFGIREEQHGLASIFQLRRNLCFQQSKDASFLKSVSPKRSTRHYLSEDSESVRR